MEHVFFGDKIHIKSGRTSSQENISWGIYGYVEKITNRFWWKIFVWL